MIGDNPESDGLFAKACGIDFALVLTGVITDVRKVKQELQPKWVIKDLNID